ncbi:hypothetical protein NMG60_11019475 [Bertholletia excelsa]
MQISVERRFRERSREMEWLYPKRRGPEWKQGWTERTLYSISLPPLPLLAIFAIVIFLLFVSQYTSYKAQVHSASANLHLFLFLLPILLAFIMLPVLAGGRIAFWASPYNEEPRQRGGGSPWGVAILVVVLLVLVSYHSSVQSKWFGAE